MLKKLLLLMFLVIALTGAVATPATAQTRVVVGVGGYWPWYPGWGYGFGWGWGYGWRGPWAPYAPWGWYGGPYGPYGYGYYGYGWASARIEIQPKTAEVFVDGSAAGIVNDFDSWYQSLNLAPGEHDIAIYMNGYKTQHHKLYFSPGSTQHIKGTLEKLAAGEQQEPRPLPVPRPQQPQNQGQGGSAQPPNNRPPQLQGQQQLPGQPQYPSQPPSGQQQPPPEQAPIVRFGTLSLRVQPGDADVIIDAEHWTTAVADQRLTLKLASGRHHLEVHKSGYEPYVEDILIRADANMALNVGLTKR